MQYRLREIHRQCGQSKDERRRPLLGGYKANTNEEYDSYSYGEARIRCFTAI